MAGKFSYAEAVKGSINTYYDLVIDIKDSHNKTYGINVVLSSQCSSHNTTNRSRASALGTLLQTTITTSGRRAPVSGPSSRAHIISICKQCHLNHVLYLQIGFNIIIPMFCCLYLWVSLLVFVIIRMPATAIKQCHENKQVNLISR